MAIRIYGDIGVSSTLGVNGVTLEEIISQAAKLQDEPILNVWIQTRGGDVQLADDIYDYLKSLNKTIITHADGNVDSAGVKIFLAGDQRIVYKGLSSFTIHNPWTNPGPGESDHFDQLAKHLKKTEQDMAGFYAKITGNTVEAILPLMKKETKMDHATALNLGFATEEREKDTATLAFINKNTDMSQPITKKEFESKMSGLEKMFAKFQSLVKTEQPAVGLVVQDATGAELDFTDLEESAVPTVGDKATVDGAPANGDYVMPDGSTYSFSDGALSEIKEPESDDDVEALKRENAELKDQLEVANKKNTQFEQTQNQMQTQIKSINAEIVNFKKSVGSTFNYKPEDNPQEKPDEQKTSRSLWKEDPKDK